MIHSVELSSPPSNSFRCTKAANSLDIDLNKKLTHKLTINGDLESNYNVGLIVGSSGSGKTTLAKKVWGADVFKEVLDLSRPVIDQFPEEMTYDDCANALNGVGLTQVPCWIRPAGTLSNGQRFRAEIALQIAFGHEHIVIDEWTSVVDRTVAKAMSFCIQKHARRTGKKIVLLSCHYDVIEWLEPDWIVDCNLQSYEDRRLLRQSRTEKLHFEVRECSRDSWKNFSRYHYLSENLPGGFNVFYGLFHNDNQIGFTAFSNYTHHSKDHKEKHIKKIMHSNRTVIHPDYVGLGLGVHFINHTCLDMVGRGYDVRAKFSSIPVYKALIKHKELWRLEKITRDTKIDVGGNMNRHGGFRLMVKCFVFRFIGKPQVENAKG